jgi:RNA polymerase sigma factor (TIGR02999 family)
MDQSHSVTRLLLRLDSEGPAAENELYELVYEDLQRIAAEFMSCQPRGHTLETGALVNEAYLRLTGGNAVQWKSRRHFINVAARAMRSVLADHARRKATVKRGQGMCRHPLDEVALPDIESPIDTAVLVEAMDRLTGVDAELAKLVELHFFAGLTFDEIAQHLGKSVRSVFRAWNTAKTVLWRDLYGENPYQTNEP